MEDNWLYTGLVEDNWLWVVILVDMWQMLLVVGWTTPITLVDLLGEGQWAIGIVLAGMWYTDCWAVTIAQTSM